MKSKVILLSLIPSLAAGIVQAADVSLTVTPSIVSDYMFRGVRLGGSAFQPAMEVGVGKLTAGLWASAPIADRVPGLSDPEVDLYASYSFALSDRLSIVPGFSAYLFPNADPDDGFYRGTYEPYLAVNYTVKGIKLTPKVYYDLVLQGPTFELSAGYAVTLKALRTELSFSGSVGTFWGDNAVNTASPKVKNTGSYYLIGLTMPFELAKHVKLTPGITYTEGFENYFESEGSPRINNSAAVARVVGTLSLSLSF
jgi:uncharacterized protein (TIGR02001 family)